MPEAEIHIFLLWPNALSHATEILTHISHRFVVLDVFEVSWTSDCFARNLTRFYSTHLPPGSDKETHCGIGPFLLIVVRDHNPVYLKRDTTRGVNVVNANIFDARKEYRSWTGGGHRVHATLNPREAEHDLFFLLGRRTPFYAIKNPEAWMRTIRPWPTDLIGAEAWSDLGQFFHAMELSTEYAVLFGVEYLLEAADQGGQRLLTLLVHDRWESVLIANGRPITRHNGRLVYEVLIGGQPIVMDFRQAGEGYFDSRWEAAMIGNRVRHSSGAYVACARDRRHALLYEMLVRPSGPSGVSGVGGMMLPSVGSADGQSPLMLSHARAELDRFLEENAYQYTQLRGPSVAVEGEVLPLRSRLRIGKQELLRAVRRSLARRFKMAAVSTLGTR